MMKRQLSIRDQNARREALDDIASQRPLCAAEQAERESLDNRLYHRIWRAQQREAELAQRAKLQAQIAAQRAAGQRRHVA